jgi:hypothetical protein
MSENKDKKKDTFSYYDVNRFELTDERCLVAFWLPLSRSEFARDINSQEDEVDEKSKRENETSLVNTLYKFFKNDRSFDDTYITVYGPKRMKGAVKNCYDKFSEKQSTPYIKIKSKFVKQEIEFEFIADAYGFYFFDFKLSDKEGCGQNPNKKGIELLKEILKNQKFCFLTPSQQTALEDALVRKDLKYVEFHRKIKKYEDKLNEGTPITPEESGLDKFISNIAVNPFNFKYDIRLCFKSEEYVSDYIKAYENSSDILSERIYDIAYIEKTVSKSESVDELHRLDDSKKNDEKEVFKLILQDKLEMLTIESFLRIASSENYLDGIIKSVKSVREHLVEKLSIMTSNYKSPGEDTSQKESGSYEWSEENIERYVEFMLSKYPSIKRIDNTLNSSYYTKIGNFTSSSKMDEDETVRRLAHYNEWENSLDYLKMTLDSFKQLLYLYHSKKNYLVLEEIQRQEISNADLEDVKRLSHDQETVSYQLSEQDRSLISLFGIAISFLVAIKIVLDLEPSLSSKGNNPFYFVIIAIIVTSLSVIVIWCILKIVEIFRKMNNIIYTRMNLREYRSKHSIGNKIEHKPPHDNFCNNVEKLLREELIPGFLEEDEDIGRRSYIVRLDPYKRRIILRYFTKDKTCYQYIRPFENLSNGELVLLGNSLDKKSDEEGIKTIYFSIKEKKKIEKVYKKIYIRLLVIYSFNLRMEKEDEFQVFKDGIKIYYSIGFKNEKRFKKVIKSLDDFISQDLYNIFIRHLHGVTKNT